MTSAIRDGRLKAFAACSELAAVATSSERMFSAAWAPIASDTVPTSAAATAIERREMRSPERWPNTFITGLITIHRAVLARSLGRARELLGLLGCGRLTSNYAQFAAPQQTNH